MRIIDLAKKQLNSEKLPKHIRYNDEDLYFDGVSYYDKQGNNDLLDILAMGNSAITHLYDEIEIIEEDKKIEKIKWEEKESLVSFQTDKTTIIVLSKRSEKLKKSLNQLIDAVNELKGGNNE